MKGIMEGYLNKDLPDVLKCVSDSHMAFTDFKTAVDDFEEETLDGVAAGLK